MELSTPIPVNLISRYLMQIAVAGIFFPNISSFPCALYFLVIENFGLSVWVQKHGNSSVK
jgi:hypothetical protein